MQSWACRRLTGKVLAWTWVRAFSPFINTYAFCFLVGGAAVSAWHYSKSLVTRNRFVGNVLIAVGALLPGIGGAFTRFGYTEVLYVTEFLGLALIFLGYQLVVTPGIDRGEAEALMYRRRTRRYVGSATGVPAVMSPSGSSRKMM